MKVYVVSWYDGEGDNLEKLFVDEVVAEKFVKEKNEKSYFEWSYVEMKVEE